ncbi:glycosyltransferase family 2 protein [bacterium]|nr:glycosyltransferase family 2 protein [bacterium]
MKKNRLITIGVPTYNSGRYIKECLDSIIAQSYTNLEIIVSDNGSTDDTKNIVLSYNDPRIIFRENRENLYCYGNYNAILRYAKGDFISFYHSDDIYTPQIVEKQVEFLNSNNGVGAVFTEAFEIDTLGKTTGTREFPEKFLDVNSLNFKSGYNGFLEFWDFLICPSGMFVREMFSQIGSFKEENYFLNTKNKVWLELLSKYKLKKDMIFTANDLDMWLRILQVTNIGILHKKLMYYRVHSGQGSQIFGTDNSIFFVVMDYYSGYAKEEKLVSKSSWKKYELWKLSEEFASGQRALLKSEYKTAQRYYLSFLKNLKSFNLPVSSANTVKIIWAVKYVCFYYLGFSSMFRKILIFFRKKRGLDTY